MVKIMVSAGEVSGDMHAAAVLKKVQEKAKNKVEKIEIFGMGSAQLKAIGAEIIIDPTEISSIGYIEALKNLKTHFSYLKQMKKLLKERKPDLVFLVDYSAFNMKLAKACHKEGIKAVNYFPPSAWLYNKRRAKKMASYKTKIAAVFPMEKEVYQNAGAEVTFVGHPLVDLVESKNTKTELKKEFKLKPEDKVIALFPGSRKGEIESLLADFLKVAARLKAEFPELKFMLAAAEGMDLDYLNSFVKKAELENPALKIKIFKNSNYKLIELAEFIITASGTTTLEAAILNTAQITAYKPALTSYLLAKYVFKIKYIALPNIIAEKKIVPEFVGADFKVEKIVEQASKWLKDEKELNKIETQLQSVQQKLGGGGAVAKTAELLLQEGGLKNNG